MLLFHFVRICTSRGLSEVLSMLDPSTSRRWYAVAHSLSGLTAPIVERLRVWSKTLLSHEKPDSSNPFNDLRNTAGRERFDTRLRLIFDSIPALIHTSRPDGYIDYFNQNWLTYVGRSLEDIQGWKWTGSIHPDDVEGILERWRASLATGEPFLYETRVRRGDGEFRWMLHRKVPLRDEHGKIIKWYGSSIDIEDRKCTEEQLRRNAHELQRSESYLAEGQRLAHLGSWAFDHAGFPRAPIVGRGILHAGFGFPILLRGDVLGVMEFFSHKIKQPDQELLDMMATLGTQIGQFIERKRAEEAVRTAQMELAHVTRVATLGEMTASIAHET